MIPNQHKHACGSGNFLEVIDKLPHSKVRVPYTYHHDYLIKHTKRFQSSSRGDVASEHTSDDNELYAIALVQLMDMCGSDVFRHITSDDIHVCRKAKEMTDAAVVRYNI